jgi:hypothetical protein
MSDRLEQSTIVTSNGTTYEIGRGEHGWLRIRRVEIQGSTIELLGDTIAIPPEKKGDILDAIEGVSLE